jgi:phenylacetate-coenzyme A ligase PaaK-like adenylate-forming protein
MNKFGFNLDIEEKNLKLLSELTELSEFHYSHSPEYRKITSTLYPRSGKYKSVEEIPWLPVRLFKDLEVKSIEDTDVFRILTSSGTTGQQVSKIYLDKVAAATQVEAMAGTLSTVLGEKRLPMLIVDSKKVTMPSSLSARGAGVLGMMNLGRRHTFALNEDEELDTQAVIDFLAKYGSEPFFIFGFTYMVWLHLIAERYEEKLDLSNGILIHGGGWKKLIDVEVDNSAFRETLSEKTGLTCIHNFYGMVEQIGTIYLESPVGDGLYAPNFADVIIRDPISLLPMPLGEPGLIQVLSTLPRSYPGHSLLTEDMGVIMGVDDGYWPGKRFAVMGRLPKSEVRGCSDTFSFGQ